MHIFNIDTNLYLKIVGGGSWANNVPNIEYALNSLFLENDYVQQPVIFSNIKENQILGTCTSSISLLYNIQQNKRLFTQNLWE
jgi:hypothetical protein